LARYKVLQSVAHSLGHSFDSTLTWAWGDYVTGHLLQTARKHREPSVCLDLLSAAITPDVFVDTPGGNTMALFSAKFAELVQNHKTTLECVRSANLRITFDLSQAVPYSAPPELPVAPTKPGSPYDIDVEIVDDRGTGWSAHFHGWAYPSAGVQAV
jgi:hypothetical protein